MLALSFNGAKKVQGQCKLGPERGLKEAGRVPKMLDTWGTDAENLHVGLVTDMFLGTAWVSTPSRFRI